MLSRPWLAEVIADGGGPGLDAGMNSILRVHAADDVVVALRDLECGQEVSLEGAAWTVSERIPAKHKFAARALAAGELVRMYGVTVGVVTEAVGCGGWLHSGNLVHASAGFTGKRSTCEWVPPDVSRWSTRFFRGFRRGAGRAGTANHWIVIPLVFCGNRNLALMREALTRELGYSKTPVYEQLVRELVDGWRRGASRDELEALRLRVESEGHSGRLFPNVDGIQFLEHGLGCGGTRQDARVLCRLLAGYIHHPNVAGATVLSLGCQHAQVSELEEAMGLFSPGWAKPVLIYEQQKCQSERSMMERALRDTFFGVAAANEHERECCALSDLVVGVECGGSDGFSGLSANPVVGRTADLVAALGGAVVLSEFPELCGVEQSLCDRCVTPELAEKFVRLMRSYEAAARACGSGFDANPSPGNIRDGLITDAMKSAGAARKGGTSPVVGVCDYAEPVREGGGLTLCCTPGNDVESTTGLAGAGCTVMLFTTGLGTPTGNPVCPTLKLSTHTALARRMPELIDYDCGPVLTGGLTVEECGEEVLERVIATASGEYVPKAVELGQVDFLPWKRGVSL